jgi:hypothetical protein
LELKPVAANRPRQNLTSGRDSEAAAARVALSAQSSGEREVQQMMLAGENRVLRQRLGAQVCA